MYIVNFKKISIILGGLMKKFTALVGVAALAGIGYAVGKKVFMSGDKKNAEEPKVFVKESHSEKLRKASMFAVGAIKTGTDKVVEGINDIINKDMVKTGEETYELAKESARETKENIKGEIENLKNMVVSINTPKKDSEIFDEDYFGDVEQPDEGSNPFDDETL